MSGAVTLRIAPDCGDSPYLALYDAAGHKLALIFDEAPVREALAERDTLRGDVRRVRVECNKAERDRDIYHAARNELARQRDEWRRRWSALGDATEELRADRDACKSAWQLTADAANLLAEDLQRVRGERDTAERVVREARDMLVDHTITDEIAAARALAILEGPRVPEDEK